MAEADDHPTSATASAPASVGNATVGYDILGFAVESPGDRVYVERIDEPTVRIEAIEGRVTDLPRSASDNTATAGLVDLRRDLGLEFGFAVSIDKGIPLGSGMGGSAASAVAGVVAAAGVIDEELDAEEMLTYALVGEAVASGSKHGDNVTPSLFGGLTLTRSVDPVDVVEIPVPEGLCCALVRPDRRIDTARARRVVPDHQPLSRYVEQSANLAAFIAGCHQGDVALIQRSLSDVLVEPHRSKLIPGFSTVRRAALEAGALACSISGAGPSMVAWTRDGDERSVAEAMAAAFRGEGEDVEWWAGPIASRGAQIVERDA